MAISTVKLSLNGTLYNLTKNTSTGKWEASITAPVNTSYNENPDHCFHGSVVATDNAGNTATATIADFPALALRVLEKVAPTITVIYPTAGAFIANNKPTFKWEVKDSGSGINTSSIKIIIDGTSITSGITKNAITGGFSCEYTPSSALTDGSHTVKFDVDDNDGNHATQVTVTFKIDTVPPVLNVTSPLDGLVTNNPSLNVTGNTNDATSSPVSVKVNGQDVTVASDGSFSKAITLTEGSNTITVVATDSAGKSTTVTRTVTLDTSAPVITSVSITPNPVDAGATYIITVEVSD